MQCLLSWYYVTCPTHHGFSIWMKPCLSLVSTAVLQNKCELSIKQRRYILIQVVEKKVATFDDVFPLLAHIHDLRVFAGVGVPEIECRLPNFLTLRYASLAEDSRIIEVYSQGELENHFKSLRQMLAPLHSFLQTPQCFCNIINVLVQMFYCECSWLTFSTAVLQCGSSVCVYACRLHICRESLLILDSWLQTFWFDFCSTTLLHLFFKIYFQLNCVFCVLFSNRVLIEQGFWSFTLASSSSLVCKEIYKFYEPDGQWKDPF